MTTEPKATDGASSGKENESQLEPVAPTAKVELKEGSVLVDGKRFVAESHLIAAKKSLEGKLEQQQKVHDAAIDAAKLAESSAQQQIATLNAKLKENEQARESGAVTDEAAAKVKQELETTKSSIEQTNKSALEYRRALMVMKYGVAEDTIKEKTMPQLDAFEEALKAVATARGGVGPYATGGGTGEAAPQTPMERAAKILASTPVRGTRTAETSK